MPTAADVADWWDKHLATTSRWLDSFIEETRISSTRAIACTSAKTHEGFPSARRCGFRISSGPARADRGGNIPR